MKSRGAPLPKRNAKRAKKRRDDGLVYGWYHRAVMKLPCAVAEYGKRPHRCDPLDPIDGHHDVTVKNGGKDEMNEIPLCRSLHTTGGKAVHRMGRQGFQDYHGICIDTVKVLTWRKIMTAREAA